MSESNKNKLNVIQMQHSVSPAVPLCVNGDIVIQWEWSNSTPQRITNF